MSSTTNRSKYYANGKRKLKTLENNSKRIKVCSTSTAQAQSESLHRIQEEQASISTACGQLQQPQLTQITLDQASNSSVAQNQLQAYSKEVSKLCPLLAKSGFDSIAIILTGDFNLDISQPENVEFLRFMNSNYNLNLLSEISSTTLGSSCIDMVFVRYIDNISCHKYISYFSYHKPILIKIFNNDN